MTPAEDTPHLETVTIFRSRLATGHDAEFAELEAATEARVRSLGGLVEFKTFVAPDGERLSLVVFEGQDAHERWREDELHQAAQRAGKARLFSSFEVLVCRLERRSASRPRQVGA